MGRKRKTISVEFLRREVNYRLEMFTCSPEVRRGMSAVLESVLMETENYHGYNFLAWVNGGCEKWQTDGKPRDNSVYLGDKSRRIYY